MNQNDAVKHAAELVKAALATGWLNNRTGEEFAKHAGDAIAALAKKLKEESDR